MLAGLLLLNLNEPDQAVVRFRQAVYWEPDNPTYVRWLEVALENVRQSQRTPETTRELR